MSKGKILRFSRQQRWAYKRQERGETRVAAVIGIRTWAARRQDEVTAAMAEELRLRLAAYNTRVGRRLAQSDGGRAA